MGALFGNAFEGGNGDGSGDVVDDDKDGSGVVLASSSGRGGTRGGKKQGRGMGREELMSAEEVLRRVLQGIARPLQVRLRRLSRALSYTQDEV